MRAVSARYGTQAATEGEDDILGVVETMARTLGGAGGEAARREAWAVLEAIEVEGCAHPEPVEGALELLRRLRDERGLPVAVITRNCRRVSEVSLLSRPWRTTCSPARTSPGRSPHSTPSSTPAVSSTFRPPPLSLWVTCGLISPPAAPPARTRSVSSGRTIRLAASPAAP